MGRWGGRDSEKSGSRDIPDGQVIATDPLTDKGEKIEHNMEKTYGPKKGESVFYASRNKGTIKGVDASEEENVEYAKLKDELKGLISRGHGGSLKAKELRSRIEHLKKIGASK